LIAPMRIFGISSVVISHFLIASCVVVPDPLKSPKIHPAAITF
jgi:hypothetical protein